MVYKSSPCNGPRNLPLSLFPLVDAYGVRASGGLVLYPLRTRQSSRDGGYARWLAAGFVATIGMHGFAEIRYKRLVLDSV
jgi:hypothetical protein